MLSDKGKTGSVTSIELFETDVKEVERLFKLKAEDFMTPEVKQNLRSERQLYNKLTGSNIW
jgi:hypothetical protein